MNPTLHFLIRHRAGVVVAGALLCLLISGWIQSTSAQMPLRYQRGRGQEMLSVIKKRIQENYYDPAFHQVDLETQFREADELIKQAESSDQIYGIIARFTLSLNDSHTFFFAPQRFIDYDYGWNMKTIGDHCYVTAVKPGSDAQAKGLKEGDLIRSVAGMTPNRSDFWKIKYLLNSLRPQPSLILEVQSPAAQPRRIEIAAKMTRHSRVTDLTDLNEVMRQEVEAQRDAELRRHRYFEMDRDIMIWKMPEFDLPKSKVNDIMKKARDFQTLIFDLRGNSGGAEETVLAVIGNLFDRDIKVGDLKRRKEQKPLLAKTRGKDAFSGKVVILVDSESASSSELLARVVQLEKRGTVIGDRTAGAVMRSRGYSEKVGLDTVVFYGASITDADVIMSDGKSLEKVGVTPDELMLPIPMDLVAHRDPVMARAITLAGRSLDMEKAGALFPVEWKK